MNILYYIVKYSFEIFEMVKEILLLSIATIALTLIQAAPFDQQGAFVVTAKPKKLRFFPVCNDRCNNRLSRCIQTDALRNHNEMILCLQANDICRQECIFQKKKRKLRRMRRKKQKELKKMKQKLDEAKKKLKDESGK